jgi:hypothetical protein
LLESATQVTQDGAVVALIAYDHPYPEPLKAVRPITAAFGMALILTPRQSEKSLALIDLDFISGKVQETTMPDPALEALRQGVPAARGLPLLAALANGKAAHVSIPYFQNNYLDIRVTPC